MLREAKDRGAERQSSLDALIATQCSHVSPCFVLKAKASETMPCSLVRGYQWFQQIFCLQLRFCSLKTGSQNPDNLLQPVYQNT
jgi:hypothetical protein